MRLIDADVLMEQMKRRRDFVGRASDPVCLVEDAKTVGGWVSVKDKLPETSGRYLTYENFKNFEGEDTSFYLTYYSAKWQAFNAHDGETKEESTKYAINVDYWMPLPEPPIEVRE